MGASTEAWEASVGASVAASMEASICFHYTWYNTNNAGGRVLLFIISCCIAFGLGQLSLYRPSLVERGAGELAELRHSPVAASVQTQVDYVPGTVIGISMFSARTLVSTTTAVHLASGSALKYLEIWVISLV